VEAFELCLDADEEDLEDDGGLLEMSSASVAARTERNLCDDGLVGVDGDWLSHDEDDDVVQPSVNRFLCFVISSFVWRFPLQQVSPLI